ncbi:hypothetical protein [Lactococcus garvieae]|uniref:hypothetical protein n=1 Tax=Lactococcus garvieae TaxID=1363 RepID=UPI0038528187
MKSSWKRQRLATKKRNIKRSRYIKQEFEKFVLKFIDDVQYLRHGIYKGVKKIIKGLMDNYNKQKKEVVQ